MASMIHKHTSILLSADPTEQTRLIKCANMLSPNIANITLRISLQTPDATADLPQMVRPDKVAQVANLSTFQTRNRISL